MPSASTTPLHAKQFQPQPGFHFSRSRSMNHAFQQETPMPALTLDKAKQIIDAAFAKGAELNCKPLGVSVLDAGAHLVAFQRQDGASFLRPQMSAGKAYGALAIGMGSRRVEAFA